MASFVQPRVYWVGYSEINDGELSRYLKDTDNLAFLEVIEAARSSGLSNPEILCSVFAKLCYKSLTVGQNANVTKVRDIESNLANCFDVGHGSVFEHVNFNFIINNCSRVFTHELCRHRVGTAYSQTSGRYVRLDAIDFVYDPILGGCEKIIVDHLLATERAVLALECKSGLRMPPLDRPDAPYDYWVENPELKFDRKKKLTSAIRRIAPNGQSNEMAFSVNLRALRHIVMLRTSRGAEWEIRFVFQEIYKLIKAKYPMAFHGAKEEIVDGIVEVTGMKAQPYEKG